MQEVFVSPAVLEEVKRIIEDSEVGPRLACNQRAALRFPLRFFTHQSVFCVHLQERTAYRKVERHACVHRRMVVLSATSRRRY